MPLRLSCDSNRVGGVCSPRCPATLTARLNVVASLATFLSALSLFVLERPQPGPYVLVDDSQHRLHRAQHLCRFTTSIFSASYIAHELETGRLTRLYLRFYHAMYQT